MKVLLAGYNVDANIVEVLKDKAKWDQDNVTPETLSASYARISRDPRDINKLREVACAEVDNARKSNESIIFGFNHHSVAEHAVFNIDIIDISRLAVEEIQKFRLASFTEKSQRYITLDGDFLIPEDIKESNLCNEFNSVIETQNNTYNFLYEKLRIHLFNKFSDIVKTKTGANTVDGWAKEDARYVVSLATLSQFGMTINARTLEYMLRRFKSSKLIEINNLADRLFSLVGTFSPSIIQFTDASPYDTERPEIIKEYIKTIDNKIVDTKTNDSNFVKLQNITKNADDILCASIIFNYTGNSIENCIESVKNFSEEEKLNLIKTVLTKRNFYDNVDRNFEMVDFTFEMTVSASNYAQLKRHRMSTQTIQDYSPALGYTIPPNITEIGIENEFKKAIEITEEFYSKLSNKFPDQKNYILTNAHRRRVLLKLNARELYHLISLREDEHAQWDIRNSAKEMRKLASNAAPLTTMMLCGKHNFEKQNKSIFG